MPSFDDQVFLFGHHSLAWGTTLATAEATLVEVPRLPTYGGWPTLRGQCLAAYGLATTEGSLRAPGRHKPVLQVSYELAPPPYRGPYVASPAYWLRPLTQLLGPPNDTGSAAGGGASNVVAWAHWQRATLRVSLSVFGGLRHDESGTNAAGLFVDWQDELAAARPFYEAAQAHGAILEAQAAHAQAPLLFATQLPQGPYFHSDLGSPTAYVVPETQRRQAQRALYCEGLLETPACIQALLTDHQVALWAVPGRDQWAVSTRWDTVLLTAAGPPTELLTLRPGRGHGAELLYVGDLQLRDASGTAGLAALATAIEQQVSSPISHRKEDDS